MWKRVIPASTKVADLLRHTYQTPYPLPTRGGVPISIPFPEKANNYEDKNGSNEMIITTGESEKNELEQGERKLKNGKAADHQLSYRRRLRQLRFSSTPNITDKGRTNKNGVTTTSARSLATRFISH